jgi:alpha-1,3-mannosyltransferase
MKAVFSCILVLLEIVACFFIIYKIPYTEIDWKAYMNQVHGFLEGQRDYFELKGDTGPIVYDDCFTRAELTLLL